MQGAANVSLLMKQSQIARKQKLIAKMEKQPVKKIPITDFTTDPQWVEESRQRNVAEKSAEDTAEQHLLLKRWATYNFVKMEHGRKVKRLFRRQKRALEELKKISPDLHREAIKVDMATLNFSCRGPVQSLPRPSYLAPLGGFMPQKPPNSIDNTNPLER